MGLCIDYPCIGCMHEAGVNEKGSCQSSINLQQPAAGQAVPGSVLYQINAIDICSVLDQELHCVEVAIVCASDQGGLLHLW